MHNDVHSRFIIITVLRPKNLYYIQKDHGLTLYERDGMQLGTLYIYYDMNSQNDLHPHRMNLLYA